MHGFLRPGYEGTHSRAVAIGRKKNSHNFNQTYRLIMSLGLVGKKIGMTRVFTEAGFSVPVTVVHVPTNRITHLRTTDTDGYQAIQVTYGEKKSSHINKPQAGHFAKSGVSAGNGLKEFRLDSKQLEQCKIGSELKANLFSVGQKVSVSGISKGKGFAGPVKRHNFRMQDATHGNSLSHRAHGSTGQCQDPGHVFKGKKMAGQMGNARITTKNLEVVEINAEQELLLIKGSIPGAPGGEVVVKPLHATEVNFPAEEEITEAETETETETVTVTETETETETVTVTVTEESTDAEQKQQEQKKSE